MFSRKKTFLYVAFSLLFFLFLLVFSSNNNYFGVSATSGTDQGCINRGGECQWHDHKNPYGSCTIDGSLGRIIGGLCNSKTDLDYRCCVKINKEENNPCKELGGTCIYVSNPNQTTCEIGGRTGTIHRDKCFADASSHYRCCVLDDADGVNIGSFTISPSVVETGETITVSWTVQNATSCILSVGSESSDAPARDTSRSITVIRSPGTYEYSLSCTGPEGSDSRSARLTVVEEGEDPVISDRGCAEIGGNCEWVDRGRASGGCTLSNGDFGCYLSGLCRSEEQKFHEEKVYLCCAPEDWCDGEVDYDKWGDVIIDGDCPFSLDDTGDDRIHCRQGPYTDPSHSDKNSVDIVSRTNSETGTEYFLAPSDGCVTRAVQVYNNSRLPSQRCGGILEFEADNGVTYRIIHAFIFASLQKGYDPNTGAPKAEERCFQKGDVLARVALETDNHIINFISFDQDSRTCASGAHFHVDVLGIDKCADCHFVDDLGCNLRNPFQTCDGGNARCWRQDPVGGNCEHCTVCGNNPAQYCCESDCIEIDGIKRCRL